jgi:hypothetical protein
MDLVVIGINNKFQETIENTVFELCQIAGCSTISQLTKNGFGITQQLKINDGKPNSMIIYLTQNGEPFYGYHIYIDRKLKIHRLSLFASAIREMIYQGIISKDNVG